MCFTDMVLLLKYIIKYVDSLKLSFITHDHIISADMF